MSWRFQEVPGPDRLRVPLLVLVGVEGNAANASNRVGVLTSNVAAATAFRRLGVRGLSKAFPILAPIIVGSLVGSYAIDWPSTVIAWQRSSHSSRARSRVTVRRERTISTRSTRSWRKAPRWARRSEERSRAPE